MVISARGIIISDAYKCSLRKLNHSRGTLNSVHDDSELDQKENDQYTRLQLSESFPSRSVLVAMSTMMEHAAKVEKFIRKFKIKTLSLQHF